MVNARPRAASISYLTDTLPTALPPIFDQVQNTTANHRKNIVALRKIQETCAGITERNGKGQKKLVGEKAFNTAFVDMVNRVLPIKKGVGQADRVVKFVAGYVGYATELESKEGEESDEETFTTRFIGKLLKHLLAGMDAKDKNVRFRVTLMTVSMINGLGELEAALTISDDMYIALRKALLERSRDKETAVRVQAALGLSKLQSGEDEDDLEEGEEPLSEVLLDILRYDPAAEVRRAAIYNLPRTSTTLPHIIARTRDVDPTLRRTVYHGSLSAANLPDARMLTIAQREEVVRNGLGDREGSVRKAAAGMLGGWVDGAEGDLIQFLGRFDVISSGEVAEEALMSLFVTRPEILDTIELDDAFWAELTPEKTFLARVFGEHLRTISDDVRFEDSMPVVTALAFKTQDEYNTLAALHAERVARERSQSIDEEEQAVEDKKQAAVDERAFVVGELLKLSVWLDYADETGRRKMFHLTREMLSQPNLPESLVPRCLDVLTKISDGERDLIRVIVDIITELRQGEWDEEPISSQASTMGTPAPSRMAPVTGEDDPETKWKKVIIDVRCLEICINLLERVNSNNSVFHGLVPDLIIKSVTNKEEPALREAGMAALGLCCMIDLDMAQKSIALFVSQLQAAEGPLKVKVAQIVFDLMMVHDTAELFVKALKVVAMIKAVLDMPEEEVQAVAVEGVAKLMLAGMMYDDVLLHSLVSLYFSPETAENQAVRQCLTYFLPVFCYSSPENQRHLLDIFPDCFELFLQLAQEWDGDRDLVPVGTMGLMLVDWLDPFKVVEREGVKADYSVHLDLGIEMLKLVMTEEIKETRKTLVSLLSKLNLPEGQETEAWKVQAVSALVTGIRTKCPLSDSVSKNALNKLDISFQKKYLAELDGFDVDAFGVADDARQEVKDLAEFIDDVEEREDASAAGSPKKRRTRRGVSEAATEMTDVVDDEDDGEDDDRSTVRDEQSDGDATPKAKRANGSGAKSKGRRRVGTVDTEEEDEDDDVESILDE